MTAVAGWTVPGAGGEVILGNAHRPEGAPRGVIVIAHGFKGYKDYGMFPCLARRAAAAGFLAHRFNFSHSGMTNEIDTFARPDLFERDTWNKQVLDVRAVVEAIRSGAIEGGGLPFVLFGHSRGGVAVLLAAGRGAGDPIHGDLAGVITAAAPSGCTSLGPDDRDALLARGYLESPSSRTGQTLRVGRVFLQEQIDDPEGHDLLAIASRIAVPVLIVHGADDPTVPAASAEDLGRAIGDRATVRVVSGGDHVFNTPNPMEEGAEVSVQLGALLDAMTAFCGQVCGD